MRAKPGVGTIVKGERGVELSRERVVEAAVAIADDEGTDALTMRVLARELGVATMSLYRHVKSRDELLTLMIDAVLAEQPPPKKGARGWRQQLELIARMHWEGYRRHPWLAHSLSMTRPQLVPNGMRHTEAVLAALAELRLDTATTLRTGVMFLAYVRGMATSLEAEVHAEQDTGLDSDQWMDAHKFEAVPLLKANPTLAKLAAGPDVAMGVDVLFECGLECLLDGIAARRG